MSTVGRKSRLAHGRLYSDRRVGIGHRQKHWSGARNSAQDKAQESHSIVVVVSTEKKKT